MASIEETGHCLQGPQKVIPGYPLRFFISRCLFNQFRRLE